MLADEDFLGVIVADHEVGFAIIAEAEQVVGMEVEVVAALGDYQLEMRPFPVDHAGLQVRSGEERHHGLAAGFLQVRRYVLDQPASTALLVDDHVPDAGGAQHVLVEAVVMIGEQFHVVPAGLECRCEPEQLPFRAAQPEGTDHAHYLHPSVCLRI